LNAGSIADQYDAFFFDLDGVLYTGEVAVAGAPETLAVLRSRHKQVRFLTNNPWRTRDEFARKLAGLGFQASPDEIVTSVAALGHLLAAAPDLRGQTALVIGSDALRAAVVGAGLRLTEDPEARDADVVVVGSHAGFHYGELRAACQALRRGARCFATNRDPTFPMPDGPWPGTGAVLAAVEVAGGSRAEVAGKPEPHMFAAARATLPRGARVVVVGDRLDTDIAGGIRAGLATVLVFSGVTAPGDVASSPYRPDHAITSVTDLLTEPAPVWRPGPDAAGGG